MSAGISLKTRKFPQCASDRALPFLNSVRAAGIARRQSSFLQLVIASQQKLCAGELFERAGGLSPDAHAAGAGRVHHATTRLTYCGARKHLPFAMSSTVPIK